MNHGEHWQGCLGAIHHWMFRSPRSSNFDTAFFQSRRGDLDPRERPRVPREEALHCRGGRVAVEAPRLREGACHARQLPLFFILLEYCTLHFPIKLPFGFKIPNLDIAWGGTN